MEYAKDMSKTNSEDQSMTNDPIEKQNDENILEVEQNFTILHHEINDPVENFKVNWKCSEKCCSC